ncbi:MAG: CDP-glycerol glycerophosphotransferase family protein [Lachnospiraceae bacterium]|nr:CDP-glycerol glycerophosphotransferase family protein [Lachnospiraceae bacterium]
MLSVIWVFEGGKKKHQKTLDFLKSVSAADKIISQVILCGAPDEWEQKVKDELSSKDLSVVKGCEQQFKDMPHLYYKESAGHVTGELVTMLYSGDTWSEGALSLLKDAQSRFPDQQIFTFSGVFGSGTDDRESEGMFRTPSQEWVKDHARTDIIDLSKEVSCHPFYLGGTFLKKEVFDGSLFTEAEEKDGERRFFLDLLMEKGNFVYISDAAYKSTFPYEGDPVYYSRLYEKDYYLEALEDFWLPYLEDVRAKRNELPEFLQYHVMASIRFRFYSNANNKNKHLIEGDEEHFTLLIRRILSFMEDKVIFNERGLRECYTGNATAWIYGILKYGDDFRFMVYEKDGHLCFGSGGVTVGNFDDVVTNVAFIDAKDDGLEIDGSIDAVTYSLADEIYFMYGDRKFPLSFNGRYMYKKYFGIAAYKSQTYNLKLEGLPDKAAFIGCYARIGDKTVPIAMSFENSHFSRIGPFFKSSYWSFKRDKRYLITKKDKGLLLRPAIRARVMWQEFLLFLDMLFCADLRAKLFILIRAAFFVTRPFIKRRPIWMYLDKIYKGGDSSEYLFRYASSKNDGIGHYYLIDKNAPDHDRLVKDGFKPLKRRSLMHRLIFLMADMMVISNSTVFNFNDFGKINSSYVRDLHDFHVCCVQHGMSVQKIAIAQNRLKDNTRLYFCASKYEIENLSRPVYDYEGYDALYLTGVPRYDGLKNRDKKQILISPTWRMQAAVPIRGSEGHQRDYNIRFRETPYFKVYNSLINDERLRSAARRLGYRIVYVLHPIVSAQAKDFDKNDDVDIVPSTSDMSYEKVFCESSIMVTDFSGVQFDFAYMRKPVVYLHHRDIPKHYEEGSFFYDTMAFGEICEDNDELVDVLISYMENGCRMKEEYVKRADDFFEYDDDHNCERIYNVMRKYMDEKIRPRAAWKNKAFYRI